MEENIEFLQMFFFRQALYERIKYIFHFYCFRVGFENDENIRGIRVTENGLFSQCSRSRGLYDGKNLRTLFLDVPRGW